MSSVELSGGSIAVDDDGLGVTFTLGGQTIKGRLPLITRAIAYTVDLERARTKSQETDNWDETAYVQAAAIGLCWQGPGLDVGDFRRDFGRDMGDYGEAVVSALILTGMARLAALPAKKGKKGKKRQTDLDQMFVEIATVAGELGNKINALIPTQKEVDEAREDFTVPPSDTSDKIEEEGEAQVEASE